MARPRNPIETVQITLSTTPLIKIYLEALVGHGIYGKTAADAAERLISAKIAELKEGDSAVAKSLNQSWQEYQTNKRSHAVGREA